MTTTVATRGGRSSEEECPRPASSHVLGSKTSTSTHVIILVGLIMLSYKQLNPVARSCALLGVESSAWCGHVCVCMLVWAVVQDYKNCLVHAGRVFLSSLLSIFVSSALWQPLA